MDAQYFRERLCVQFGQYGKYMLSKYFKEPYPSSIVNALDSLEFGMPCTDPLAVSTRELASEFIATLASILVVLCMKFPKTSRQHKLKVIDVSNTRIRHGYANDEFILCGGLG